LVRVPLVCNRIAAVGLVAVLAGVQAGFAPSLLHGACAARQHACGRTAVIAACCCMTSGNSANTSGPAQSAIVLHAPPAVALPAATIAIDGRQTAPRAACRTPRPPDDLPILLSNLRI